MITPDLTEVNNRVVTYACGTCGEVFRAPWIQHEAHYQEHKRVSI